MIQTSYFGNWRKFPSDVPLIAIARRSPAGKFLVGLVLAPSVPLLRDYKEGKVSEAEYRKTYFSELSENWQRVGEVLKWADQAGAILLCYEKTGSFCHRHLIKEWLDMSCPGHNIEIKEL